MTTATITDNLKHLNPEQRLFAMGIAVILDRVRRLEKADSDELFELFQLYRSAEGKEEILAADEAIWELIAQEPVSIHEMDLETDEACQDLEKWKGFISARIREHRKLASLTQEDLAEKTGLPQSHISRIENGKHSPSHMTLEKIAAALSIPVSKLDPTS